MRFTHKYKKMPIFLGKTKVIEIFIVESKHVLSRDFLLYDTTTIQDTHYNLPEGKLLVIVLLTDNFLWTTIRSSKYETYFRGLIGKYVNIVVTTHED
jgi:hypothetical protein